MPTATKNPPDLLARLRRLPALRRPTAADLARLRAVASDVTEPVADADSPDVGAHDPKLIQANPALAINVRNAAWFARHGGTRALNQALRAWIQSHHETPSSTRRQA